MTDAKTRGQHHALATTLAVERRRVIPWNEGRVVRQITNPPLRDRHVPFEQVPTFLKITQVVQTQFKPVGSPVPAPV